jgi:hypothetical protein
MSDYLLNMVMAANRTATAINKALRTLSASGTAFPTPDVVVCFP